VLILFLSVFHVIGAAVLAKGVRELWRNVREGDVQGCRSAFMIVWAVLFGCVPFGFGIGFAGAEGGTPLVLLVEILVWSSTFLVALLAQQVLRQVLEPFMHEEMLLMLFGGGFLVAGLAMATLIGEEDGFSAPLMGGIFALLGTAVFGYGLWRLLQSTS
jgi:tryptophan-rich sensory protein